MVGADRVAAAFGLSTSGATLEPLRHGDLPTWTLITTEGRYVVKALAATSEEFRRPYVERAMILERYASEAGIRTPVPLPPTEPDVGWCTKINGHGWFRAHAWVDHRPLRPDDEIAPWLGRTMATLHRLMPIAVEPDWPSIGIHDPATWAAWIDAADRAERPWAGLGRSRLTFIGELTERLRSRYASAPDWVVTHADPDRHNVLIAPDGPVLIDWDTVWPYSAALQAGQVALLFGRDRPDRIRAILDAYRDSGGRLDWAGGELFVSAAAHRLAALGIRIQVLLGQRPAPRWLDLGTADQQVDDQLRRLPGLVDELDDRARLITH